MKKISLIIGIIILILVSGCTQTSEKSPAGKTSPESSSSPVPSSKAICGNGVEEAGETSANCCLDVPCQEFFTCKELEQGDKTINTCVKAKLEETKEYKNFLGYLKEESMEYEKELDLINFDYILTKIEQMDRTIQKLDDTYDVSIEKTYIQYRYNRREWNVKRAELVEKIGKETDEDKQKDLLRQIINLDKQELTRLENFSEEEIDKISSKFDYDILERQSLLKSGIDEEEKALGLLEEGYQIEISVVDYNPTCSSYSNTCYLEYVKLNIKNTGGIALQNPAFDFYIYKGDQVISRDIDQSTYELGEIPVGYEGIYKETYVGYDNKESITPGSYTLKVNLKRGVSTNAIATTSTTVNMR